MYPQTHAVLAAGVAGILCTLKPALPARKIFAIQLFCGIAAIVPDIPTLATIAVSGNTQSRTAWAVEPAHSFLTWALVLALTWLALRSWPRAKQWVWVCALGIFLHILGDILSHGRGQYFDGHREFWPFRLGLGYWLGMGNYNPWPNIWPKQQEWAIGAAGLAAMLSPYAVLLLRRYRQSLRLVPKRANQSEAG